MNERRYIATTFKYTRSQFNHSMRELEMSDSIGFRLDYKLMNITRQPYDLPTIIKTIRQLEVGETYNQWFSDNGFISVTRVE